VSKSKAQTFTATADWSVVLHGGQTYTVKAATMRRNPDQSYTFRDADGIKFDAPPGEVTYVCRREAADRLIPLPAGLNLAPGQIRELQDSLRKLAGLSDIIVLPPGSKVRDRTADVVVPGEPGGGK